MKRFNYCLLTLLLAGSLHAIAQHKNTAEIPGAVLAAFNSQHPQINEPRWKAMKTTCTASFQADGHKYNATYTQDGQWLNTTSKIKWSWKLPPAVQAAFKHSRYATWEINTINELQTPEGGFYQLLVDDGNLQIDAFHEGVFTKYWLIDFAPGGTLVHEKNVTEKTYAFGL